MFVTAAPLTTDWFADSHTVALFPTYDAPRYKYGYQVLILFGGLAIAGIFLLRWQEKHDK